MYLPASAAQSRSVPPHKGQSVDGAAVCIVWVQSEAQLCFIVFKLWTEDCVKIRTYPYKLKLTHTVSFS